MTTAQPIWMRRNRLGLSKAVVAIMAIAAPWAWQIPTPGQVRADESPQTYTTEEQKGPITVEGAFPARGMSPGDTTPSGGLEIAPTRPTEEKVSRSGRQIYQRLLHASAWILARHSQDQIASGSAWLVDRPDRLLITNHHVVARGDLGVLADKTLLVFFPETQDGKLITEKVVEFREGRRYEVRVVDYDPNRDLAILQVEGLPTHMEPLTLAREGCQPSDTVHSIGNPAGEALWVYTAGMVRAVFRKESIEGGLRKKQFQCVETSSPINPGDSGGPVVNDDGELVAVNMGKMNDNSSSGSLVTFTIDVSEVKAFLDEVRPMLHPKTADDYNQRGLRYLARDRIPLAVPDFDEALKQLPSDGDPTEILFNRGRAYDSGGLHDKAVSDFTQALASRPHDPEILICRGEVFLKTPDLLSAQADFEEAIKSAEQRRVKPDVLARAYFGRAKILYASKKREDSVESMTQAIRLDPQNFMYHLWRGARLGELPGEAYRALNDADKAIEIAKKELDPVKWIKIQPYVYSAFHNRAHAYARMNRREEALQDYGRAIFWTTKVPLSKDKTKQGLAKLIVHMGREMHDLGFIDQAYQSFAIAEKIAPELASERPTFHERRFYFENKSRAQVVLYFKYHTLANKDRWEWRPGDLTTANWVQSTFEPGQADFLKVDGKPILADRVRFVVRNDKNETINQKYWNEDLILVPQGGYQGYIIERYTFKYP